MTVKSWAEQRQAIVGAWKRRANAIEQALAALPAPAPTLYREQDADQAVAHAGASVALLAYVEQTVRALAKSLAPHFNACVGYDFTDAMVIDLDLPSVGLACEWAEAKHEYTEEDAAEEAAEHRGDMERDGV